MLRYGEQGTFSGFLTLANEMAGELLSRTRASTFVNFPTLLQQGDITMGTRSVTTIFDGDYELVRIYRQHDGYPEGQGIDLAKLCDVKIVNGLGLDNQKVANGMGDLAAQIVAGLKDGPGGIYIEPTGGEISDWAEYIYIVRGDVGSSPTIECTTQTGPWPFNTQTAKGRVFKGDAKAWIKKFSKKKK